MKFIVMVKEVPVVPEADTEGTGRIVREGVPSMLDPHCRCVLEDIVAARAEGDDIIAVTMGPPQAVSAMEQCLEAGADAAYLLSDRVFAGADAYATARTLAAFVTREHPDYDLIVCGDRTADSGTAQVPGTLARMLCAPQFYYVRELRRDGEELTAVQDYGDAVRSCRVTAPAVVSMLPSGTCCRQRDTVAVPAEVAVLGRVDLGLGAFSAGTRGSKVSVVSAVLTDEAPAVIDGSDADAAAAHLLEAVG